MSNQRYTFSNDWFAVHEPHWRRELIPWAAQRSALHVLEIGSYEGQSACWLLDHLLSDPRSRLTCADLWQQSSGDRLYPDDIDAVFDRFQANIRATGRAAQVTTLRGDSRALLPTLADESFDLVYVDGDHSAQGVCFDSLEALRLVKQGGIILWDDYFWSSTVRAGVDMACRASGVGVERMGENACFRKTSPLPALPAGKIIGLVPARNEGARIEFCLRALADYTDAIVYLDDCSTDDTLQRVESLAKECRVERILPKTEWLRDEPGDRNRLLQAGRELGGTHFVVLDADEAFTANFKKQNLLRRLILSLKPGEQLSFAWIQFWRGLDFFRHDQSVWTNNYKFIVFCDDGKCFYASDFIHTSRSPANLPGPVVQIPGYDFGLMHFQFANWQNLLLKQAWYRCLERIRQPGKPAAAINELYAPSKDETGLGLKPAPPSWLDYPFLDRAALLAPDNWRQSQIEQWLRQFDPELFRDLDIWDVVPAPSAPPAPQTGGQPRVSVIVSTYNGEKFIGGCLDDLAAQTMPPDELEIIVIDSGSPQNEGAIVREHQKRAKNIVYVRTERETIYAAWNRAARLARGALLTNANVDDRHAPDALEKLAGALEKDAKLDVVYANCAVTNAANNRWGEVRVAGFLRWPSFDRRLLFSLCFIGPQPMWRKSLHDRFGFFDPVFTSAGDYEFWLRISAGARFLHLPETLGLYLDHAASIEHSAPLVSQQEAEAARKKHWPKDWGQRPSPAGTFFRPVTMADGAPPRPRVEIVKDGPLVSVIIPTCSRPATLPAAVRSVLAQTMQDFEILVVNDAGPDVSDLLRSLGQPEKIVSLRQETKRERSAARNLGLARARGQFIAYLDDDDIYYPDHLEKLCAAVHLTGAKVAYADSLCASPVSEASHLWRREPFLSVDFDRKKLLASNYIPILCLLHARKCLEAAGAFDEQLNSHEDWEFFIRLSRHFDFVHVKKVTCEFRSRVETEAGRRGRHKELLRTAELVYERNRMYVGADSDVIKNQQAYLDGLKEKCKPIPSDGMPWFKYRLARPFHNLRHSLRKRLAKKT